MYILYRRMSLIPSGQQGPPGPPGPPGPGSTNDLATTLGYGNSTGGITIQANTASNDGEMTTDILNVSLLKPLDPLVLGYEIGIEADLVFLPTTKVRFEGEAIIQSDTNIYKLVDVPQVGSALPNVLAYDPTTEQVFYQAVGAGSTTVNNVDTPAGDTSLTITPNTGNVKISLPVVATAGTTTNPDSITIDDRGRVTSVVAGTAKVSSVSAGTNIGISGTATAPIVSMNITTPVDFNSNSAVNITSVEGRSTGALSINSYRELSLSAGGPDPVIIANNDLLINGKQLRLAGLNSPLMAVGGSDPAGDVGQYLTSQGPGNTPAWTTRPTAVGSVTAGTNINLTGTSTNPVVNLNDVIGVKAVAGVAGFDLNLTPDVGQSVRLNDPTGNGQIDIGVSGINAFNNINMNENSVINAQGMSGTTTGPLMITAGIGNNVVISGADGVAPVQGVVVEPTQVGVYLPLNMATNAITGSAGVGATLDLVGTTLSLKDQQGTTLNSVVIPGGSGSVNSVSAGTNISVSGTATDPVVNVDISADLNMNDYALNQVLEINGSSTADLNIQPASATNLNLLNNLGANAIRITGTNIQVNKNIDNQGNSITNVASLGVQQLQNAAPILVGTAGFDLQNSGALYRTAAVVGSTTQPLNITAGVGQELHLNDNIGNTKVAVTTATTEVYNNIDMNANYIQEVSNISGTNSLGSGARVITVSAIDGAGFYSQGIAKLGLDNHLTDVQVVVDNRVGSKGISLTPQANPIYINGSAGLATQVLQSQGPSLPPIWASVGGGGGGTITSVVGGSNIAITGTATDPVVNLTISQNVNMNNHFITSCEGIGGDSTTQVLKLGDLSAGTHIEIDASATNSITMNPAILHLDMTGEIQLNNQPGTAGQVLTTQGAGLPPIWTTVGGGGGGVQNPMTSDLDANNYRITNLDEITPGTSSDLDIALPALGALQVKNAGTTNVSLGGPNVAVFNCASGNFPALINTPTSLGAVTNTSVANYGLLKEAFLNNAINLDGSITISEPAIVYGTLREKTISLPNIGAGTSYTTDPVKSITVDGKGRITSTSAYLTGPVESISAGTGITVGGTATIPTITNDGVLTVSSGTGITIGGTAQNPQVQNDGVLSVSGVGLGISIGGTPQNPTIENTGIWDTSAGLGISITGAPHYPVIENTGLLGATAGVGISVGLGQYPTLANTGVLSLTAGSGITISGSTGNINISATGGGGSGNVFEDVANGSSVAEASKAISNGTIALGNNLGNIVSLGTANTAIGQNTLSYVATPTGAAPQRCVALGSYAHQNAQAGAVFADTVVIGTSALESAFGTQQGCVCIGHNAGRSANLSSGVCIGRFAGEFCNTGDDTIVGPYASRGVGGGYGNVAIGLSARDDGSTGIGNICVGFQCGIHTVGDYNVFLGPGVGQGSYGVPWTVSKTTCIGYQYDNATTTGTDAFYMDNSDTTTANGGRAAFWAANPAKVRSTAPCVQVAGDAIVSGIFQGASSRIKTGVVSTATPIPSTGYSTPAILSGRSFTYPYNHNLFSTSGSWKLKVSLTVSGIGVNHDLASYLEIYNNTTAGTTSGFLFGLSYQQASPHTTVNGIVQNTIHLEDVFSIGDFSQGDLLDINLYVSASAGAGSFFSGGNWVFEYKLIQE